MTGITLTSRMSHFSKAQLEAIDKVLSLLDPDEFRDYHDQFGVCNAPDTIEVLRNEVRDALHRERRIRSE
jgi:hypothetical protein